MATTRTDISTLPVDVQALIASLTAKSKANERGISLKVTAAKADPKTGEMKGSTGAIAMYGLGRFPVTLYRSQWERLAECVKSGQLDAFIAANAASLSVKGEQ